MPATVHGRVADAKQILVRAGLAPDDAALDAEVLARHVLGWDRATLLTRGNQEASPEFDFRFAPLLHRRALREPVAHITGHREFWSLDFEVTPDVLIPRPETELIVEAAVDHARIRGEYRSIIDLGTGSGCLAVALATEFRTADVTATDRSGAALAVAARNAARHGVQHRVRFVRADLLEGIAARADLIVSNPPYVALADAATLPPDVVQFEPAAALFAGRDGLEVLRRIIATGAAHLSPAGVLIVEFGFGQTASVRALAEASGWGHVSLRSDLAGIPRVAVMGLADSSAALADA
jgi:release factor glutamine methyltransferase